MKEKVSYSSKDFRAIEHLLPGPDPELVLPKDGSREGMIPISETSLGGNEAKYLAECVASNWISSAGSFVGRLEGMFAERVGCEFGIACSSGTTALNLALATLDLKQGDEVILPTFTMIAVANAVAHSGARPVLVDAEPVTGNMDVAAIESRITERTRAILPVHTYGHPLEMNGLMEIARRHDLKVIEDAAEAHGARFGDRPVGGIGDAGIFSFYGNKIITTGEGGMITTNDPALAAVARTLRDHAFSRERHFWHEYRGFNYRMTNLEAAVGVAQVERFDELVEVRRRTRGLYEKYLAPIAGVALLDELEGVSPVAWMNCVRVTGEANCGRDEMRSWLAKGGIETRSAFIPIHLQPVYYRQFRGGNFPVADSLCREGLLLPSGPLMTEGKVAYIAERMASAPSGGAPGDEGSGLVAAESVALEQA